MDKVKYYEAQFDKQLSQYAPLKVFEEKTKVPKVYAVGGVLTLTFTLLFFNIFGSFITTTIGFIYPAYASFRAIESARKDDDTQWLTYWAVYGFLSLLEQFSDLLLYWFPFYYLCKAAFLVWLALPATQGAHKLYVSFLRPTLLSHSKKMDGFLHGSAAKKTASGGSSPNSGNTSPAMAD